MKAAIFDMDGLLFDSEKVFDQAWQKNAKNHGFVLNPKMQEELRGCSGVVMRNIVHKYLPNQDAYILQKELFENAMELEKEFVPMKPGVYEILKYFKENNYQIALASSSPLDMIENNLKITHIENYFDCIVNGNEVEKGKPHPDIFLLACKKLNCKPEACFVFEDAKAGVAAGYAAGCKTIMIPDLVQPSPTEEKIAFGIFKDLYEALNYIQTKM